MSNLLKLSPYHKLHRSLSTKGGPLVMNIPLGPTCPPLQLRSGQLARLADGCAVASLGQTAVMATVCKGKVGSGSFLPLTVDYRQKAAAAGRIPTNFLRRELGPSEREILTSRMIDRSVRPLAAKGFLHEVGISCNLLAMDGVQDPEVLGINSASMALAMSSLPWQRAVGAVRVGWSGGTVMVNPGRRELARSEVNLVVVGTSEGLCTMLEGEAKCIEHNKFLECVSVGLEYCAEIARQIDQCSEKEGKTKVGGGLLNIIPREMVDEVRELANERLRSIYTDYSLDKLARDTKMFNVRDDILTRTRGTHPLWEPTKLSEAFSTVSSEMVRGLILDENIRVDGRGLSDIRPISCQVNLHDPLHGSALFQRGQTQVMCTVALDSLHSAMKLDPMTVITGGLKEKNFLLHYEFPSYATGEVGRGGAGANRREMGHGALAEKALKQVMPDNRQFTVRLTSEVLESNGSSSMASVCGGSLALLDAGVKLSEVASGVAMGLVTRGQESRVLTDIMGMEDYLGDMDFKLAATRSGVCAIQADVKIGGIDMNIIKKSVEGGMEANHKILDIMNQCIEKPVESKECWPVTKNLEIPAHKRGKFLGPAGLNVKRVSSETGVQIQPEEEGMWSLFAPSSAAMEEAEIMLEELLEEEKVPELVFGAIYTGKIVSLLDRGVMLELHPAMDPVLVPNSQLDSRKISHPSALGLTLGQDLQVKYYGRDPATGQVRCSRKVITVGSASAVNNLQNAMKRNDSDISPALNIAKTASVKSERTAIPLPKNTNSNGQQIHSPTTSSKTEPNEFTYKEKTARESQKNITELVNLASEKNNPSPQGSDEANLQIERLKTQFLGAKSGKPNVNGVAVEPNLEVHDAPTSNSRTIDPASLLSRDTWSYLKLSKPTEKVIKGANGKEAPAALAKESSAKSEPNTTNEINPVVESKIVAEYDDSWKDKYDPPLPAWIIKMCKVDFCELCNVRLTSPEVAKSHYEGVKHAKKVQSYLKKGSKYSKVPNGKFLYMPRNLSHPTRQQELDDIEAEVHEIAIKFSKPTSSHYYSNTVSTFVERSVQNFQTLLEWLEELESADTWDENAIVDVNYGLKKIQRNLVGNIRQIEDNYKYQQFYRDCAAFVGVYINKPDHYLFKVANNQMQKMDVEFEKAVEELAKNVSIGQRMDQKLDQVWSDYHEARMQLKQFSERLWELEAHEERLAELDDWRNESGHWTSNNLQELCGKIDKQHEKIIKYTRQDLDMRWSTVDKDMKELQLLRIQSLLTWISEQPIETRPHWLCDELAEYIVEVCREYIRMEDSACEKTGWLGVERNSDHDLGLEMAYSRIRASLASVKYARIENRRHTRELEIYRQWGKDNKEGLRDSTSGQLFRLLSKAQDNVKEVDMRLSNYVSILSSEDKSTARELESALDTSRIEKRKLMKEVLQTIKHSWKGDGRTLPFVTYDREEGIGTSSD